MPKIQMERLIIELEGRNLNDNEEVILELLKMLTMYREFDTSNALFDLRVDVRYFWQRLTYLENEIKKYNECVNVCNENPRDENTNDL